MKLEDVLKYPSVLPLFADQNDTTTALTKLTEHFHEKVPINCISWQSIACASYQANFSDPIISKVNHPPSLRVSVTSSPRVPITQNSARNLRAKNRDMNRSLMDNRQMNHMRKDTTLSHRANAVLSESGESLEHRHLTQGADKRLWELALANDLGRLAQGVGSRTPTGTGTTFFMHPSSVPKDKKILTSAWFLQSGH